MLRDLGFSKGLTPDHPAWFKLLDELKSELVSLFKETSPDASGLFQRALVDELDEMQLAELSSALRTPAFADLQALLAQLGLTPASVLRMAMETQQPSLYSKEERADTQKRLPLWETREREFGERLPRTQTALALAHSPAFQAYLQMTARLMDRINGTPGATLISGPRTWEFAKRWRERFRQGLPSP